MAPKNWLIPRLKHLQEICEDVQLRDWVSVRNYHKICMHRIEQGTATWGGSADLKANLKMRYIYMAQGQAPTKSSVSTDVGPRSLRKTAPARKISSSKQFPSVAAVSPCEEFNVEKGCHLGHLTMGSRIVVHIV